MRQELVGAHGSNGQQRKADDDVRKASRGNIEHQQKDGVEQDGRAQVAFEDNDEQAHAPHGKQRQQQAEARNLEAQDLAVGDGKQLAVLGQIACQEQDDEDLGELAGLDGEALVRAAAGVDRLLQRRGEGGEQADRHGERLGSISRMMPIMPKVYL